MKHNPWQRNAVSGYHLPQFAAMTLYAAFDPLKSSADRKYTSRSIFNALSKFESLVSI